MLTLLGSGQGQNGGLISIIISSLKKRGEYFEGEEQLILTLKNLKKNKVLREASILITPTAYSDGVIHASLPIPNLSLELIIDGNFENGNLNAWQVQNDASLSGNQLILNATSGNCYVDQNIIDEYKKYLVTIDVESISITDKMDIIDKSGVTQKVLSIGINKFYLTGDDKSTFRLRVSDNAVGVVNSISVKQYIDADLDFTRGSLATRTNDKGLIVDVDTLGPEKIANGSFDEIGPEVIGNSDFETNSDWNVSPQWSIDTQTKQAIFNSSTDSSFNSTSNIIQDGKTYLINIIVDFITEGTSLKVRLGDASSNDESITESGNYTFYSKSDGTSFVLRRSGPNVNSIIKVSKASAKQVDPNNEWVRGGTSYDTTSELSFLEDKIVLSNGGNGRARFSQRNSLGFINGLKYKVTITIDSATSTSLLYAATSNTVQLTGETLVQALTIGENEFEFISDGKSYIGVIQNLNNGGNRIVEVSNFVVTKVIDATNIPRIDYSGQGNEFVYINGVELIQNNSNFQNTDNWNIARDTETLSFTNDYIRGTSTEASDTIGVVTSFVTEVGETYVVNAEGSKSAGGTLYIRVTDNDSLGAFIFVQNTNDDSILVVDQEFVATSVLTYVGALATSKNVGEYTQIESISVKKLKTVYKHSELIERQSTNFLYPSEGTVQISNPPFSTDGFFDLSAGDVNQGYATTGLNVSVSFIVKKTDGSIPTITSSGGTGDLVVRVAGSSGAGIAGNLTSLGNGFYLFKLDNYFAIGTNSDNRIKNRSGEATYISRVQYEIGDLTSYIKTETEAVTRLAAYNYSNPRGSYLFEGQTTNLIRNSNDFAHSDWNKLDGSAIISDQAISPSGKLDADLLTFAELTSSRLERWITTVDATEYTISVYVKKATYDGRVSIGITGGIYTTHTLTDDWVRISFKVTSSGTLAFPRISNTDGTQLDCYVYGWQMEEGDLTSYIPTELNTSTRLADRAGRNNIGDLINSEEGTIVVKGFSSGTDGQITLSDGTIQNIMQIRLLSGTKIIFISKLNNATTSYMELAGRLTNTVYNIVVTWKLNEYKLYIDDNLIDSGTGLVASANTYTQLRLDRGDEGGSFFEGDLEILEVWKRVLTAEEISKIN